MHSIMYFYLYVFHCLKDQMNQKSLINSYIQMIMEACFNLRVKQKVTLLYFLINILIYLIILFNFEVETASICQPVFVSWFCLLLNTLA